MELEQYASDQSNFNSQTVIELEQYAVKKSQDTSSSIRNAIRTAKDTEGVATTTLETLHTQAEQIRRTHDTALRVDEELGRGEKLLGSLGGFFTTTWKPKKAHKITGPQVDRYRIPHLQKPHGPQNAFLGTALSGAMLFTLPVS